MSALSFPSPNAGDPPPPHQPVAMQYAPATLARAARAVACSSFQLSLFTTLVDQSVPLLAIAGDRGIQAGYSRQPLSEFATERELFWLIQVGVLRREVDGQGLTDRFRLTPLGYQLVAQWRATASGLPRPTWRDRLQNAIARWFRFPFS
ncbi:Npun_F0494 family protein [Trichothermofontia sp.]